MSAAHVTHEFPRAYEAATKVDPLILASALDHIARTAARSRSQTRRVRWIEQRALFALRGQEYRDIDVDLPASAGPDTPKKLQRRMAYHIAVKHELREALIKLRDVTRAMESEDDCEKPTEDEYRAALEAADVAIVNAGSAS